MASTDDVCRWGDRILVLDGGTVKLRVSSDVMRLACPAWNRMFDRESGFKESSAAEIHLPEDDPGALRIILHAAHHMCGKIPRELQFKQLVQLAILCDKYDTTYLVNRFTGRLVAPYLEIIKTHDADYSATEDGIDEILGGEIEALLLVAWTFGHQELFDHVLKYVCRSVETDSSKRLVFRRSEDENATCRPLRLEYLPPFLDEYIREMRLDAVEELLEVNREELANLHGWCKNNLEYMEPGGDEVFSLMEMAAKQWTSSGVSAEEYPGSATELVDVVPDYQEEVERTFRAPADAFFFNQPSVICSRAGSRCWRILEDMPSSTKRHRRHMAKQAAK